MARGRAGRVSAGKSAGGRLAMTNGHPKLDSAPPYNFGVIGAPSIVGGGSTSMNVPAIGKPRSVTPLALGGTLKRR